MANGRPEVCAYCKGTGRADDDNSCGFCDNGVPLDTQEDWDATWGRVGEALKRGNDAEA